MAISIDWGSKTITVPQADLTPLGGAAYEHDTNAFRLELKALEDDEEGMPYPDTHRHQTTVTLGGVTLARTLEIINGYTVTYEDGQYSVALVGSNNNIADVMNLNQVSLRSTNSAGLIQSVVETGVSGLTAAESLLLEKAGADAAHKAVITDNPDGTQNIVVYKIDDTTPVYEVLVSADRKTRTRVV